MALVRPTPTDSADSSADQAASRDQLMSDLGASDPAKRRWAARDLLAFPDATGVLIARLQHEDDLSVRDVILTSLTRIGDFEVVEGLIQCLRSEDVGLRNEAIVALQSLPNVVGPLMQWLLKDSDPDVRIFAVNILESLRHPHVERWLIGVLETEQHVNVCATAVDLLAELGTPASRHALEAVKTRFAEEPFIQFATDLSLRRIDEQ